MRCTLAFCARKVLWWQAQLHLRDLHASPDTYLAEGLHAYAAEQATFEGELHSQWSKRWASARKVAQPIINGHGNWELDTAGEAETIELWEDEEDEGLDVIDY